MSRTTDAAAADPPGSHVSLAILFAPAASRPMLRALYALRETLHRAALDPGEDSIALLRLQWWRAEIERLLEGEAQHPTTRALQGQIAARVAAPYLGELLEGAAAERFGGLSENLAALGQYCFRTCGALQVLAAAAAGDDVADPQGPAARFGRHVGNGVRLVELIRDAAIDARAGRCRLPQDLLRRHGVAPDALYRRPTPATARALLAELAEAASVELRNGVGLLSPAMRARQRSALVMAALATALLEQLRRRHFDLGAAPYQLGAWRKLLVAWRTARRSLQ